MDQRAVIYMDSELLNLVGSILTLAPTKVGRPVGPVALANCMMMYSSGPDSIRFAIIRMRPFQTSREDLIILEPMAPSITKMDRKIYGFFPGNKSQVRSQRSSIHGAIHPVRDCIGFSGKDWIGVH